MWHPTPAHYFMRLLHTKGLLLRCYTQARQPGWLCFNCCCLESFAFPNAGGMLHSRGLLLRCYTQTRWLGGGPKLC